MPKKQTRAAVPKRERELGNFWIYAALFVCTVALYAQVRNFDFINYDDPEYVTGNPHVRQGLTADGIRWAFTSTQAANWFPVTRLSHMLDVEFFRLDSGIHHVVNVVIHAAAALLLFAFLERATRARWPSAFVAFVFALHPLHVESVAWVAERKDVLSAFFWFLGLYAYIRYVERPRPLHYFAVLAAFCLGLLSKPMIITFPFVLLLFDFWPLQRLAAGREHRLKILYEKIPFALISIAAAITTYLVQGESRAVKTFSVFPLGLRIENALASYVWYAIKTFWPSGLAVFYPYPRAIPAWEAGLAGLLLAAVSAGVIVTRLKRPYAAVGWFWFLGTLVPVIGLVQVGAQARADRYMYVPMVGLLIALAWGG
ncbi:MAG: glycosyltransferase family 39 protein, partial [Acidobacteriaceae bacterium]|nr:glycosyltransferase family 39 protein [Acidobacteriaceae bacterium]